MNLLAATTAPPESPEAAFSKAVLALRTLGPVLGSAVEVRYEAPPGFRAVPNRDGVLNPTLDLVTDPRRVDLGRAIQAAQTQLLLSASALSLAAEDVERALAAWEGKA